MGGTWGLLEGVKPLDVHQDPIHHHLLGEHLEDDESSFEAAVFKRPAEPLGVLLEGVAEPLGMAEPLEAV